MQKTTVALFALLAELSSGVAFPYRAKNGTACRRLAAKFPNQTFAPNTTNYISSTTEDIWSMTCDLDPGCVFSANSAEDVSKAVRIIHDTQTVFSVVSGGHMPVPGAQSNDGGVLIALANLNTLALNDDQSIASLGPGNRWIDVYEWLEPYGLAVPGGRYAHVGVGGILVTGGINFFGNRIGWSVNYIANMQVVLGNGAIVEVNHTSNPDLFWALKGGSNNYGIVTRYDMRTLNVTDAFGGILVWEGEDSLGELAEAFDEFLLSPEADKLDTHINPSLTVTKAEDDTWLWRAVFVGLANGTYDGVPPTLANFTAIPDIAAGSLAQEDSWVEIINGVQSLNTVDENGLGQLFGCLASPYVPGVTQIMRENVLQPAVDALADVDGLFVAISPEPISKNWLQAAQDSGEYVIDLDPEEPLIVQLITLTWTDAADNQKAFDFMNSTLERVRHVLVEKGVFNPFIYMGDAAPGQYPYSAYGKGDGANIPRMKSVQATYDPLGVFRNLITSGFKL